MDSIQKTNKTGRASNIELLRILSMFMIVGCHFATHGGFSFDRHFITVPRLWWNILELGGDFGADVFVLISGYFLIENRTLRLDAGKAVKLWGQIFFYSVGLFFFAFLIGKGSFEPKTVIKAFFPVIFSQWWFASAYFVMFLLHPYLNRLLLSFDKEQYQKFILFLLVIWSIIPTFTTSKFQSNSLLEFMMYYSIAGYIRLFGLIPSFQSRHWFVSWFCFSLLTYLSCIIFMVIGKKYEVFATHTLLFYGSQSILTIFRAVCLFMAFSTCRMKENRFINIVSSASFGVYLLHDSELLRPYLWKEVFRNAAFQNTPMIIPYSILVVLIVYCSCTIIDLGRKYIFEKPFLKFTDANIRRWSEYFEKAADRVKQKAASGKLSKLSK